ncbi:hypothetical protein ACTXT7_001641 [Hymenolepis weldensis]
MSDVHINKIIFEKHPSGSALNRIGLICAHNPLVAIEYISYADDRRTMQINYLETELPSSLYLCLACANHRATLHCSRNSLLNPVPGIMAELIQFRN